MREKYAALVILNPRARSSAEMALMFRIADVRERPPSESPADVKRESARAAMGASPGRNRCETLAGRDASVLQRDPDQVDRLLADVP